MNAYSGSRRDSTIDGWFRFRLEADRTGAQADIGLRNARDRWISVSDSNGHQVTGIGSTARAAIVASLERFGPATIAELLADLRLLDVSCRLREASAD